MSNDVFLEEYNLSEEAYTASALKIWLCGEVVDERSHPYDDYNLLYHVGIHATKRQYLIVRSSLPINKSNINQYNKHGTNSPGDNKES